RSKHAAGQCAHSSASDAGDLPPYEDSADAALILHCCQLAESPALSDLSVLAILAWIVFFRSDPLSERALWLGLLIIYMLHQIEEHLWPGGFRQFTNAHVFKSGNDNWPVDIGGVALINIGFVWLPVSL